MCPRVFRGAYFFSINKGVLYACRLSRLRVDEHDIGDVDRFLELHDTPSLSSLWLHMTSHHSDTLDRNTVFCRKCLDDFCLLSFILSRDDDDLISSMDFHRVDYKKLKLDDFRSERDNLLISSSLELSENRSKDTSSFRDSFFIDDHTCIIARTNIAPILTTN